MTVSACMSHPQQQRTCPLIHMQYNYSPSLVVQYIKSAASATIIIYSIYGTASNAIVMAIWHYMYSFKLFYKCIPSSDNWSLPVDTAMSGSATLCKLQQAINRLKHGFPVPYGPIMAVEPIH